MIRSDFKPFFLATLVLFIGASFAEAHPGHGNNGLSGGFLHPFSGIDHLLAMVAVGLWAVQLGGAAIYFLPASFIGTMLIGGLSAKLGLRLGYADAAITTSLFILGLLIAAGARLPLTVGTALVGLFSFFHGYAHVHEGILEQGHSLSSFAIGFVIATLLLHAIGIGIGISLKRRFRLDLVRFVGVGIAACAVLISIGLIQT